MQGKPTNESAVRRIPTRRRCAGILTVTFFLGTLLASCGGGDDNPAASGDSAGTPPPSITTGTGILVINVSDDHGAPLEATNVWVQQHDGQKYLQEGKRTDQVGRVAFSSLPARVKLEVGHPIGRKLVDVDVPQTGVTVYPVALAPSPGNAVALFPAEVPPTSISIDRTELELHVTLAGSARTQYPFWISSETPFPDPEQPAGGEVLQYGPVLKFGDCAFRTKVWRNRAGSSPDCYRGVFDPARKANGLPYAVTSVNYAQLPASVSAPTPTPATYSAMLLMDQSARVRTASPDVLPVQQAYLRTYAARHFIHESLATAQASQLALAAFAGPGADADGPSLPDMPFWQTGFSTNGDALEDAADDLKSRFGGTAPVLDALQSSMTRTAAQAPSASRRVVVAFLGGGDDTRPTQQQVSTGLVALREAQEATGIQVLLIASAATEFGNDGAPNASSALAEMSGALGAPLLMALSSWPDSRPYPETTLALEILSGSAMPTINLVFRLKSFQSGGFVSGSMVYGTLRLVEGDADWGYHERPMPIAVRIP